jgi:hypothetical protein
MKEEFLKYALASQLSVARRQDLGGEIIRSSVRRRSRFLFMSMHALASELSGSVPVQQLTFLDSE